MLGVSGFWLANRMKMWIIFVLVVVLIIVGVFFWQLMGSRNWQAVEGELLTAEIQEKYISPNSARGQRGSLHEYEVKLRYRYHVNGRDYEGGQLYPVLPNIFSDRKLAEEELRSFQAGSVTVYFSPDNPNMSALKTSGNLSLKQFVILFITIFTAIGFVIGGIFVFNKL